MTRASKLLLGALAAVVALTLVITGLVLYPWEATDDPRATPTDSVTTPSDKSDEPHDESEPGDETITDDTEPDTGGHGDERPPAKGRPDRGDGVGQPGGTSGGGSGSTPEPPVSLPAGIMWSEAARLIEIDVPGLSMKVDYTTGVSVTSLAVDEVEVLDATSDSSRIAPAGGAAGSAVSARNVRVTPSSDAIALDFDIPFEGGLAHETWTFKPRSDSVAWTVDRGYSLDDPSVSITSSMGDLVFARDAWENIRRTQDGGNIPVWGDRLVDAAATFAAIDGLGRNGILLETAPNHAVFDSGDLVFLTHERSTGLSVQVTSAGEVMSQVARRGTASAAAGLAVDWRVSNDGFAYSSGNAKGYASRFSERADRALLRPSTIDDGETESAEFVLAAVPAAGYYGGVDLEGIDSAALAQLVNDFGRSIVQGSTIGASSERSFRAGEAPGFTSPWNVWSLELIQDEGAFESMRQQYLDIFALPKRNPAAPNERVDGVLGGLQDSDGRIHCCVPFGAVNSSQPTYATTDNTFNVVFSLATLFNLAPDREWLAEVAPSVRLALEYAERELLVRSGPTAGLFANSQCADPQSPTGCFIDWSEWNDQYDIGQVSAYHNVFAYGALIEWAELERDVLGSGARATHYEDLADGVKERYNAPASAGGFWSDASETFAYTRDASGTLAKDCSHLFTNGYALMFNLVDTDARRATVASSLRDEYDRLATVGHVYDHGAHGGTDYTWKVHGSNPRSCDSGETLEENGWPRMYFPFFEDGGAHLLNEQPAAQISLELGDRSRNVDYARTVVDRYTLDGFMGWSNIQPDTLLPRRDIWQEPFMVNNVLGVWALYHDVLGFQPRHDGLNLKPFIDESMAGSSVDYRLRGVDVVSVDYQTTDRFQVSYDGDEAIRIGWQREPRGQYELVVDGTVSTVVADADGEVWVDASRGTHVYELGGEFGVVFDDSVLGFSSGWSDEDGAGYLGQSQKVTNLAEETATLAFTGTGATILASTGPSGGVARVTLDGVALDDADWYSPTPSQSVRLVRVVGLEQGDHVLTITTTGAGTPVSSGSRVTIDAVVVFGGAPTPPPPGTPEDVQVHPSMFTYTGNWWGVADPAFMLGELRGTSEAGASATLNFTGTGVTLSGSIGGDKGRAMIKLDGVEVGPVDWFAVESANQQPVYSIQNLDPGAHVLEIVVLGENAPGSTGAQVNLDGAIVHTGGVPAPTTMAPGQFSFTGGWWGVADPAYLSGELRGTSEAGATASLTFTGTGVVLSGSTGGDKGRASISIDGGTPVIVDWYAEHPANRAPLFTAAGLPAGSHTITITVLGERNPASVGDQVNFDGAIVTS